MRLTAEIRCVASCLLICLTAGPVTNGLAADQTVALGVAKIDITPQEPIRLAGYAKRRGVNWKVEKPLQARALALGDGPDTALIVTVELVGITAKISDELGSALARSHGLPRDRIAVCAIHTHSGPVIEGLLDGSRKGASDAEWKAIVRYATWLQGRLQEVAEAALRDRKPAHLSWAEGYAGFAVNRRELEHGKWKGFGMVPNGPADRSLPVMVAVGDDGGKRAVFTSYACHCTTNGGDMIVHSDWAGEAASQIEAAFPGAIALVALGCAGDARPYPGGSTAEAKARGREIAAEVGHLANSDMRPLTGVTAATYRVISLPLDAPDKRGVIEEVPLPVQTWRFGDDLSMIFLGGEMVADYSLRLKRELDAGRVWINAYSNAVPCYVASRRLYSEGGYEVDGNMPKYGWPCRLAIGTEDRVVSEVLSQVDRSFHSKARR